jgi:hypothetical protein
LQAKQAAGGGGAGQGRLLRGGLRQLVISEALGFHVSANLQFAQYTGRRLPRLYVESLLPKRPQEKSA